MPCQSNLLELSTDWCIIINGTVRGSGCVEAGDQRVPDDAERRAAINRFLREKRRPAR
jgi:hypothetical protein